MKTVLLSWALLALMLLWGGTAAAQTSSPFGPGFGEGVRRAAEAARLIGQVNVEVSEITNVDSRVGRLVVRFAVRNEASQIAGERTGYCVRVQMIRGQPWNERCTDENPPCYGGRCKGEIEVGYFRGRRYWAKGQVRVRYYGAGGAYTSWSPEFKDNVSFY